jgi:hypothetical protein
MSPLVAEVRGWKSVGDALSDLQHMANSKRFEKPCLRHFFTTLYNVDKQYVLINTICSWYRQGMRVFRIFSPVLG